MKKILVVDFIATTPIYTAYFCDALIKFGLSADILSPVNEDELFLMDNLELNFISNQRSSKSSIVKFYQYIINWLMVIRLANNYKAIHFQWFPLIKKSSIDFFFLKLLLRKNPNLYYTVHNILPHDDDSQKSKNRFQKLYSLFPYLVVHTPKTKERLMDGFGVSEKKIVEIKHGPLFQEFASPALRGSSSEQHPLLVSMIGSIKPYKGFDEALKLLKEAKNTPHEFRLKIVGKGDIDYISSLIQIAKELNVYELCSFNIGYIPTKKLIELHQESDAILAPYKEIDQSGAVITALSLGVPVLGYAIGGLKELINNFENGFLAPPKKTSELLTGINWVKSTTKQEVFNNCIRSIDSISWDKSIQKLATYYF